MKRTLLFACLTAFATVCLFIGVNAIAPRLTDWAPILTHWQEILASVALMHTFTYLMTKLTEP